MVYAGIPTTLVYAGIPTTLVYTPRIHPGYTTVRHTTGYTAALLATCGGTPSWAQEGDLPWVRASFKPLSPKGVKVGRDLCA